MIFESRGRERICMVIRCSRLLRSLCATPDSIKDFEMLCGSTSSVVEPQDRVVDAVL